MQIPKLSKSFPFALLLLGGIGIGLLVEAKFRFLSTPQTDAEIIMARVGRTFVDPSKPPRLPFVGHEYYTAPKPYGVSWLCRVDVVSVAHWIVWNMPKPADEGFQDDFGVRTMYGLNGSPGRESSSEPYEKSCDTYRDFEHLINTDDGGTAERSILMLDRIISAAKTSAPKFQIECSDRRNGPDFAKPCDGAKVIGSLTLKGLTQTDQIFGSVSDRKKSVPSDSLIFMLPQRGDEHPQYTELEIDYKQTNSPQSIDELQVEKVRVFQDSM